MNLYEETTSIIPNADNPGYSDNATTDSRRKYKTQIFKIFVSV